MRRSLSAAALLLEGRYALEIPSSWVVTASLAGTVAPQFAQIHAGSFEPDLCR